MASNKNHAFAAPIVSEICERLLEIHEVDPSYMRVLLIRIADVALYNERMIPPMLNAMSGNSLKVVESFNVQACYRGLTKQAVHVEWHQEIAKVRKYYSEMANLLQDMRDRADNHEVGKQADGLAHGWRKGGVEEVDDAGQE